MNWIIHLFTSLHIIWSWARAWLSLSHRLSLYQEISSIFFKKNQYPLFKCYYSQVEQSFMTRDIHTYTQPVQNKMTIWRPLSLDHVCLLACFFFVVCFFFPFFITKFLLWLADHHFAAPWRNNHSNQNVLAGSNKTKNPYGGLGQVWREGAVTEGSGEGGMEQSL